MSNRHLNPRKTYLMLTTKKEFLWSVGPIAIIALLVFTLNRANQPKEVTLEIEVTEKSKEHEFVANSLNQIERVIAAQEEAISRTSGNEMTLLAPALVPGAPLPVAWQSSPAFEADAVDLSPSLERSLAAGAELRTEPYTNPSSDLNLQRIESLRDIREQRQEQ